jgi:hypothetical protein
MSCLTDGQLTAIAFADDDIDEAALKHGERCPSCNRRVQQLRLAAAALQHATTSARSPDCLDDATVADAAVFGLRAVDASAARHLSHCGHCRRRLAGGVAALNAPEVSAQLAPNETRDPAMPRRSSNVLRFGLLAAAVATVLIVPRVLRNDAGGSRTRDLRDADSTITMTVAPTAIAPRGKTSGSTTLVWTTVPGATSYSITVFNSRGDVVWQTDTPDTTAAVKRDLPAADQPYFWKVAARTGWSRSVESDLVEFSITARPAER